MAYDTFANLKVRVGRNIGIIGDSSYDPKLADWINEAYEDIWDSFLWPESIFRDTVTTTVNQDFVTMPPRCKRILILSQQASPAWMRFENSSEFVRTFWQSLDSTSTGTPRDWTDDGESPVLAQPTSASVVTASSSSASDTSQSVRIWGRNANGVLITDSIQLNGTTSVAGTISFTSIEQLSKSATGVGTVTATSNGAAVTLSRIAAKELTMRVVKARLHLIPDTAISLYLVGKDRVVKLQNDEDIPKMDCDRALVAAATSLALREQTDDESEVYAQRAAGIIAKMRNEILGQAFRNLKMKPDIWRRYQVRSSGR